MTKITLDEAATRTLKDAVAQACARQETMIVTGPDGELARIVPVARTGAVAASRTWNGRPVYDAEQLARMSPEELKAIGWTFPDESAWMDELASASGRDKEPAE